MSRDEFPPPAPPLAVDIVPFEPDHAQGFAALVVDALREFGFEYDSELDRDLADPGATYVALWIALVDGDVAGSVALDRTRVGSRQRRPHGEAGHDGTHAHGAASLRSRGLRACRGRVAATGT